MKRLGNQAAAKGNRSPRTTTAVVTMAQAMIQIIEPMVRSPWRASASFLATAGEKASYELPDQSQCPGPVPPLL